MNQSRLILLAVLSLIAVGHSANAALLILYTNETGASDGHIAAMTGYTREDNLATVSVGIDTPLYRPWFIFNSSNLSDSAAVSEINITLNVETAAGATACTIKHLDANASDYVNDDTGNADFYADLANGTQYGAGANATTFCTIASVHTISLGADAVKELHDRIVGNDLFGVGINSTEDNSPKGEISSAESSTAEFRPYLTITYSPTDTTPPKWENNRTNATAPGEAALFLVNWTDDVRLKNYTFEFDNGNGTLQNVSTQNFTGTANTSNYTAILNATNGSLVRWRVYAWDPVGNMNATSMFNFTVVYCDPLKDYYVPLFTNQTGTDDGDATFTGAAYSRTTDGTTARFGFEQSTGNEYRGYFIFNVSSVPEGVNVTGVNLTLNVEAIYEDSNCTLRHLDANASDYANSNQGNNDFYADMGNGTVYFNSTFCATTGKKNLGLNESALGDVKNKLNASAGGKWFGIGIHYTSGLISQFSPGTFSSAESSTAANRPVLTVAYRRDCAAPQWTNARTNTTLAGAVASFLANWTDDLGLKNYTFEFDNGNGTLQNVSIDRSMLGLFNTSNYSSALNSTVGSPVRWRVYARDAAGNLNSTVIQSFSTTEAGNPPQWFANRTNSTRAGQPAVFTVNWTDNAGLSAFIFELDHGNGTLYNVTVGQSMTGTSNQSNMTTQLNVTGGSVVRWRVYANDTDGNMNVTPVFIINRTYNPVGGSDDYVAFQGSALSTVVKAGSSSNVAFSGRLRNTTIVYVSKSGSPINWARVKAASTGADMPAINTRLALTLDKDKLDWNYNHTARDQCGVTGVNVMNSTDGHFYVGSLYSDEDNSGAFNSGDTIIFCVQVNYNVPNYAETRVDYEVAFPKALGNVDFWVEGGG